MRIVRIPKIADWILPFFEFRVGGKDKTLYLSFDDGPCPITTPMVISLLERFDAKATFFCVGENVHKHPDIYKQLIERGHRVGNHSFHHLRGWKTPNKMYFDDVEKARSFIDSDLLRPPYGRIRLSQARKLKRQYRLIFWSVLSYDYSNRLSKEKVWKNVRDSVRDRDIILFHDSIKAKENMLFALENTLEHFSALGYEFDAIP